MAVSHITFNDQTNHGRMLRAALNKGQGFLEDGNDLLGTMVMMIDGDGSDSSQFTYMTTKFGFPDNATAKAAWDELNSCYGKLNTDSSVTFLHAALVQVFSKFR